MDLAELEVGERVDVPIRTVDDESLDVLSRGTPVELLAANDDVLVISQADIRRRVRPVGRGGLPATFPRPEARLAALTVVDGREGILRLWMFGRGLVLPRTPATIRLTAPVTSRVLERSGSSESASDVSDWLRVEFCLPGGRIAATRMIVRMEPSAGALGRSFSIVGTRSELDVILVDGHLEATRLAPRRQGDRLTTVLVEADVRFTTDAGEEGGATLGALLAEGGYLRRWAEYNTREIDQIRETATKVGQAPFVDAEPLPTGAWRFSLESGSGRFLAALTPAMPIEAAEDVAGAGEKWAERVAGEVEAVHGTAGTVDVRLLDSEATPPPVGLLRYAMGGSVTSHRRRLEAVQRLATGNLPLSQLSALLEMRSLPVKAAAGSRLGWDSPAVREVFGGHEPTPAQKRAIELALNSDLAVIQGPPGTGKTKVIAAVAARIAEESRDHGASRQVLLTSHQHDAVDNVASLTTVFGLPSVKEGRGETGGSWLQAWRQERLSHADQLFRSMDQGEVAELRAWVSDRREGYVLAPCGPDEASELLGDVLERCGPYLSMRTAEDVRAVASGLKGDRNLERDLNLLASVRSLRTTSPGHEDDGRQNAARVLKRLSRAGDAATLDVAPLHHARDREVLTPEELTSVSQTKELLLDRLGLTSVETATPTMNGEVVTALGQIIRGLNDRLRAEGKGLAAVLQRFIFDLESDPEGVERALGTYAAVVAATCQAAADLAARPGVAGDGPLVDTVIVDEAARANPLDLQIPLCVAERRVILVGDQRQLPHIVDDRIAASVSTTDQEARELEESLFGRLFRFLRSERESGRPDRVVTLTTQFRMHPVLGRFVSECFYEPYGEAIDSPLDASLFAHELPGYEDRCAAWLDVPRERGVERRAGTSRARPVEAEVIAEEVHRLLEAAPNLTFGIITFYRAQVSEILEALVPYGIASYEAATGEPDILDSHWRYTKNAAGQRVERLRVGTVDAFQGKEFDVSLLSTVRTPSLDRRTPNAAFGHLVVENRLCVAMSRQKRLLVLVGDRQGLTEHPDAQGVLAPIVRFARLCDAVPVHG
jgi:hypothetical protein